MGWRLPLLISRRRKHPTPSVSAIASAHILLTYLYLLCRVLNSYHPFLLFLFSLKMAELPSNEKSWLKRVQGTSFETKTIHSFESSASGSKIALPQFLLLRVLWVKNPATKLSDSSEYGKWGISKKHIEAARNHLREVSDWEQYKSTFSNNLAWHQKTGFLSLGTFSLVRLYQLNSRSINTAHDVFVPKLDFSPRKTRSQASAGRAQAKDGSPVTPTRSKKNAMSPNDPNPLHDVKISLDDLFDDLSIDEDEEKSPESDLHMSPFSPPSGDLAHDLKSISDEQIVNMALLLYLQALLINFCGIGADWTPERRALIVKKKDGQKVYEARVDGFLRYQGDQNNPILAIVEVKPCIRDINPSLDSIRMQEGAQMAAWICQHPPSLSELTSDRTFRWVLSPRRVFLLLGENKRGSIY